MAALKCGQKHLKGKIESKWMVNFILKALPVHQSQFTSHQRIKLELKSKNKAVWMVDGGCQFNHTAIFWVIDYTFAILGKIDPKIFTRDNKNIFELLANGTPAVFHKFTKKIWGWDVILQQAGTELGQAQPELGLRLNWDLFMLGRLIIRLELGLNTILGSSHVA